MTQLEDDVVIDRFAVIGDGTRVGANCRIGSHVVIGGGCDIGSGSVVHSHAVIYDGISLGSGSVVQSGACIGPDGFGFVWDGAGFTKIPQVGACRIGSGLVLGANAAIDRGSVGHTRMGAQCTLASLVHIGHNAVLGDRVLVEAHSGVAGSAVIGSDVVVGAQVAIVGHLSVGDGVHVASWGGITHDIGSGQEIAGVPARAVPEARRAERILQRLARIVRRIQRLHRSIRPGAPETPPGE